MRLSPHDVVIGRTMNGNIARQDGRPAALLVGFDDPLLVSAALRLEELGCRVEQASFTVLMDYHFDAYQNMHFFPFDSDESGARHTDITQDLLLTCDRVFLRPLAVGDLLRYLAWLRFHVRQFLQTVARDSDVLLFASTPHFPWDMILAREAETAGLVVVSLESTLLPNLMTVQRGTEFAAPRFMESGGKGVVVDTQHEPKRLAESHKRNRAAYSKSRRKAIRSKLRVIHREVSSRSPEPHYFDIYSRTAFVVHILRAVMKHRRVRKSLLRLASYSLPSEFVYIPLHNQPERTTDPEAGAFRFQELFINRVRSLLDSSGLKHWKIVVREHPTQNPESAPDVRQLLARDYEWYESLREIPGVVLVQQSVSAESLLRSCRIVATVNGSSAWEAALSGKPAITGRKVWHSQCTSTPTIDALTPELLIQLVNSDSEAVAASVGEFTRSVDILYHGVLLSKFRDGVSQDDLAGKMAESLLAIVSRHVKT